MPALSTLYVDVKARLKDLDKGLASAKNKVAKAAKGMQAVMSKLTFGNPLLAGTAAAGGAAYALTNIGTAALDTAAAFETMEVKLNQLTGGKGEQTLDRLNKWALDMPVNTLKAVDTFVMLKAMGVDPTIKSMETLVDVSSIFGEEAMTGIARAIGQVTANGRILGEELNQMAERGVNARGILMDAFGMSIADLQKANIDIKRITGALWDGLEEQYGGAAAAAMNSWAGLVATFDSYVMEMQRIVMDAGVFEMLKEHLSNINEAMKEWIASNHTFLTQGLPDYIEEIGDKAGKAAKLLWGIGKWTVRAGEAVYDTPINALGMSLKDIHAQAGNVIDYISETVDMLKLHKELRDEIREEGKFLERYSVAETLQYSPLEIDQPDIEKHIADLKKISDNAQITFDKMHSGLMKQNEKYAQSQKDSVQIFEENIAAMQVQADRLRIISEPAYKDMLSRMEELKTIFYKNLNDEQEKAKAENQFKLDYEQFLDELSQIGEVKNPYESLTNSINNLTDNDFNKVLKINEQIKEYMLASRELLKYAEGEAYQANIEQLSELEERLQESGAWKRMLKEQDEVSKQMVELADSTASVMQNTFEGVLFDALEGKFHSLEEIIEDLLKNIAKMMMQFLAKKAVMNIMNMLPGFGGGGGVPMGGGQTNQAIARGAVVREHVIGVGQQTGDVYEIGEQGNDEVVMPMNRRTKGGALGSGAQKVVINITNNSGYPIEEKTTQRFDGDRLLVNTMISAIKHNKGGIRSYLRR